jgi:dephospho-CoA kinase
VRRVRSQLPIEEKRALADFVIDNSGCLADTERQVRELYERLVGDRR